MTATRKNDVEPRPLGGEICFEEGDFRALSPSCCSDPQYNDRRLVTRRKLGALAKRAVKMAGEQEVELTSRTSLHNPHAFNGMRVRRLWAYLCRPKAERKRLRGTLGPELAKDLDAAFRNAYLCLAIEDEALEVSLRIHSDAWYDGQNLVNRIGREGLGGALAILGRLGGFRLRLHDWKGEWPCGGLTADRLEEFLGYFKPGEHSMTIEQRLPAPAAARGAALDPVTPESMLTELGRLLPLYRFAVWSKESDFLFGG